MLFRGVFRTQSSICYGGVLRKKPLNTLQLSILMYWCVLGNSEHVWRLDCMEKVTNKEKIIKNPENVPKGFKTLIWKVSTFLKIPFCWLWLLLYLLVSFCEVCAKQLFYGWHLKVILDVLTLYIDIYRSLYILISPRHVTQFNIFQAVVCFISVSSVILQGVIHIVRTQNFPKN